MVICISYNQPTRHYIMTTVNYACYSTHMSAVTFKDLLCKSKSLHFFFDNFYLETNSLGTALRNHHMTNNYNMWLYTHSTTHSYFTQTLLAFSLDMNDFFHYPHQYWMVCHTGPFFKALTEELFSQICSYAKKR